MGIASLIMGIIAMMMSLGIELGPVAGVPGILFAVLGIVFGAIGKKKPETAGLAKVGMVLSILALLWNIIMTVACVACVSCSYAAYEGLLAQ